nr:MAG TPA: hypothetical protein [Caudoviricetes sp.]
MRRSAVVRYHILPYLMHQIVKSYPQLLMQLLALHIMESLN